MIKYRTLRADGYAERVIEKSKFIGYAKAVSARSEADDFFAWIRSEHKGATHHVPAFALGEKRELLWASDDGEPQGTAGPPMLTLLSAKNLTNICLMAVRYFGGVKLGTGGLVRAYTEIAAAAIDSVGIVGVCDALLLRYEVDYPAFERIKHALSLIGEEISDISYAEHVTFSILPKSEDAERTKAIIESHSRDTARLVHKVAALRKYDLSE